MMTTGSRVLRIAPSILSADFGQLAEEVAAVTEAGADWVHVDVMDGHFAPNLTVGPAVVAAVRRATHLPLDVHLMVRSPEELLGAFCDAGADLLTVHLEACTHLQRTLAAIRELGMRPGVALNPHTPLDGLEYVKDDLDLVLLMSVNPGFGGQAFLPAVLSKVRSLRERVLAWDKEIDMEVDGGISPANIARVARAGADVFVAGTAVFGSSDYEQAIRLLRAKAAQAVQDIGA